MKKIIITLSILTLAIHYVSAQTERVKFVAPSVYPEGIAYDDRSGIVYVSSVKTGTIGQIDQAGHYKVFYKDSLLKSTFGMKVDKKNNKLIVCSGDPNYSMYSDSATFKKMARVVELDLSSGKKAADIDLSKLVPGKHFPNDIVTDGKGNYYITDSFAACVYKIDSKNQASILVASDLFKGRDVGLNGIVYSDEGFLLVVNNRNGFLYKIDLKNPSNVTHVKLNSFLPGADGMIWDQNGNLVVVVNKGINKAFVIKSTDKWVTATMSGSTSATDNFQNPTTAILRENNVWILNSRMNELMDSTSAPAKEFSFQKAVFK